MSVFPFLTSPEETAPAAALGIYTEWAYDFENERLEIINGAMRLISGIPALKVWVFKAAKTAMGRYLAYSVRFGSRLEDMLGRSGAGPDVLGEAEATLSEALVKSPYITAVSGVTAQLDQDDTIRITATVETIYGPFQTEVSV